MTEYSGNSFLVYAHSERRAVKVGITSHANVGGEDVILSDWGVNLSMPEARELLNRLTVAIAEIDGRD